MSSLYPQPGEDLSAFFEGVPLRSFHGQHKATAPSSSERLEPLLPSRNNSHVSEKGAFRYPRPYVQACCKGTLGLAYESGRIVFRALACGSWSYPHCRKQLSARLIDRARRGMEPRQGWKRSLGTLTVNPEAFGGVVIGANLYDDAGKVAKDPDSATRTAKLYAEPTKTQYEQVAAAMSKEFDRLNKRLSSYYRRRALPKLQYFRVVELHRNGWPHYHILWEHPDVPVPDALIEKWALGRVDVRHGISADDAIGELIPYLTNHEAKGKLYQFAAPALPKNFRLWSASREFLAPAEERDEEDKVEHGIPLRGHFTSYMQMYEQHMMAAKPVNTCMDLVHVEERRPLQLPPSNQHSRLAVTPGGSAAQVELYGERALAFYANLILSETLEAPPEWFADDNRFLSREDRYRYHEYLMRCLDEPESEASGGEDCLMECHDGL